MLLDDIADYLSSADPITWTPTDLYTGYLPEQPDLVTALYETGGQAPIRAMTPSVGKPVVTRPRIQIVCRATQYDYNVARTTAHKAWKLLDGLPERTINGVKYKWIAAVQEPFLMGRDEAGRVLVACNYDVVKEPTP